MSNGRAQDLRGEWWLPVRPNDKVAGVLHVGEDNGLRLSLSGQLVEVDFFHALPTHEVILGESDNSLVTLHGCRTFHVADDTLVELQPDAALIGGHFPKVDEVNLHTLVVQMESLDLWLRPREYLSVADGPEPGSKVVRPSRGAPTDLAVDWGNYRVGFKASGATVPLSGLKDKVTVERGAYLEIHAMSGEQPFGELFKIATALRQLVAFGLGASVKIKALYGQTAQAKLRLPDGTEYEQDVRIIAPELPLGESGGQYHLRELFTADTFGDSFAEAVGNWLRVSERLRPVYDLVFSPYERPAPAASLRFLELIYALEAHHRYVHGGQFMEREDYFERVRAKLIDAIPGDVSEGLRESIINRLNYAYQLSMRQRLREILTGHRERVACGIADVKVFVDEVVTLRNYLTHLDESAMEKAIALFPRLRVFMEQLEGLLTILLLRDLGYDDDGVRSLVGDHPRFKRIKHLKWLKEKPEYHRRMTAELELKPPRVRGREPTSDHPSEAGVPDGEAATNTVPNPDTPTA